MMENLVASYNFEVAEVEIQVTETLSCLFFMAVDGNT